MSALSRKGRFQAAFVFDVMDASVLFPIGICPLLIGRGSRHGINSHCSRSRIRYLSMV